MAVRYAFGHGRVGSRSATGMAAAGLLSGLISQALFSPGSLPGAWFPDYGSPGACTLGAEPLWRTLAPGFVYAVAMVPFLAVGRHGAARLLRSALFVAVATAGWYVAYWLFLRLSEVTDGIGIPETLHLVALGMVSGLVGSMIFATGTALAFPPARTLREGWPLLAAGTLAGAALAGYDLCGPGGFAFFAVWQASVAAALARWVGTDSGLSSR